MIFWINQSTCIVHVANLSKDLSLFPTHIVNTTNTPHTTDVAARVAAIQTVFIVEVNGDS